MKEGSGGGRDGESERGGLKRKEGRQEGGEEGEKVRRKLNAKQTILHLPFCPSIPVTGRRQDGRVSFVLLDEFCLGFSQFEKSRICSLSHTYLA